MENYRENLEEFKKIIFIYLFILVVKILGYGSYIFNVVF